MPPLCHCAFCRSTGAQSNSLFFTLQPARPGRPRPTRLARAASRAPHGGHLCPPALRPQNRSLPPGPTARLLLLRLSPDLHVGPQDLVALFFNMNHIWEAYLLRTIQRLAPTFCLSTPRTAPSFSMPSGSAPMAATPKTTCANSSPTPIILRRRRCGCCTRRPGRKRPWRASLRGRFLGRAARHRKPSGAGSLT